MNINIPKEYTEITDTKLKDKLINEEPYKSFMDKLFEKVIGLYSYNDYYIGVFYDESAWGVYSNKEPYRVVVLKKDGSDYRIGYATEDMLSEELAVWHTKHAIEDMERKAKHESLNNQIKTILEEKHPEVDKETLRKGLLGFLNQFGNELSIEDIEDDSEYVPHLTTFKINKDIEPYKYSKQFAITTSEDVLIKAVQEYIENEEDDLGGYQVLVKYGYVDIGNAEYFIQPEWFEKYFERDYEELFIELLNDEPDSLIEFFEDYGVNVEEYGYNAEEEDFKDDDKLEELKAEYIRINMENVGRGENAVAEYIARYGIEELKDYAFPRGAKVKADAIAKQYFEEDMMEKVFASVDEVADYYDGNNYFWILIL